MRTIFSANLGFLFTDLALPDAIRAAKHAGFAAVECHFPYEYSSQIIKTALEETGLAMLGLNTVRGDISNGDNGLAALAEREQEARAAIDQAINYAAELKAGYVHVMAGKASGDKAHHTFLDNLRYAAEKAEPLGITILIEPLNHYDAPDYYLQTSEQAISIIKELGVANLKLLFDCYHIQIMEGDLSRRLERFKDFIGHIQIASVPDRAEPNFGEINYQHIFTKLKEMGYTRPLGAEYRPRTTVLEGLTWLSVIP